MQRAADATRVPPPKISDIREALIKVLSSTWEAENGNDLCEQWPAGGVFNRALVSGIPLFAEWISSHPDTSAGWEWDSHNNDIYRQSNSQKTQSPRSEDR